MSSSDHPSSCFWRCLFLQHLWDACSLRRRCPTDLCQSQEKNFLFCPSSTQTSHHQRWEVLHCKYCLYIQRNLPFVFSHAPDLLDTVKCGYQNRSSDPN